MSDRPENPEDIKFELESQYETYSCVEKGIFFGGLSIGLSFLSLVLVNEYASEEFVDIVNQRTTEILRNAYEMLEEDKPPTLSELVEAYYQLLEELDLVEERGESDERTNPS